MFSKSAFLKLDHKKCQYLPEEDLPVLFLGIHNRKYSINKEYKNRDWRLIAHQTAGHLCNQHYMMGMILEIHPDFVTSVREINNRYLDSDIGMTPPSLNELNAYRKVLKTKLNADCNTSYRNFEEALYPIDLKYAQQLTTEQLPKEFDDFLHFNNTSERILGCLNRWGLYILGENCD